MKGMWGFVVVIIALAVSCTLLVVGLLQNNLALISWGVGMVLGTCVGAVAYVHGMVEGD